MATYLLEGLSVCGVQTVQKLSKSTGFLNIKVNFKIIAVDLQASFFDVVEKGDVHENICS